MNTCKNLLIFLAGAALGTIVTGRVLKTKYEQIAEEEIASVKEVYAKKMKKLEESTEGDTEPEPTKEEVNQYREMASGYTNYSKMKKLEEPTEGDTEPELTKEEVNQYREMAFSHIDYLKMQKEVEKEVVEVYTPQVISPDEFDTNDFKTQTLTLYADGVLADEYDNVITNVDEIVGEESLDHFGEYEEDTVYVRNEELETDFEILKDDSNYRDML